MKYSVDIDAARRLGVVLLFCVAFWGTILFLLAGCATQIPPTPAGGSINSAAGNVDNASQLATDARTIVNQAQQELNAESPNLLTVKKQLVEADKLLAKQQLRLQSATVELKEAARLSALTAKETARLKRESAKYRQRYETLKKYRVAVIIISGWILVKFLGSLGAWSPHGRLSRFLIG